MRNMKNTFEQSYPSMRTDAKMQPIQFGLKYTRIGISNILKNFKLHIGQV